MRLWRTAGRFGADKASVGTCLYAIARSVAAGIRLAHEEGLTHSQIADRPGLPLGTVKTRTCHGMRALRTALIERGFHAV